MSKTLRRLASVDALRALTMFLMIFVNDLWSLKGVPEWLDHAKRMEDRMGLADIVFPAFLFIVGLSIPFAISGREAKGFSRQSTLFHILTRSLALLIIGIFHVNLENYDRVNALLPKPLWQILITIGFFLVWLDYPALLTKQKKRILQGSGILLLALLAIIYQGVSYREGGTTGFRPLPPANVVWMRAQWYGILGLIGWCYLLCALIYLYAKDRLAILAGAFIFFLGFTMASKAGWLDFLDPVREFIWIVSSGSLPVLTIGGVIASVIYRKWAEKGKQLQSLWVLLSLSLFMLILGFALRPFWGISKIRATPSWVLICSAITLAAFVLLAYIMDIKGRQKWITPLKPAGTSTLTCYLLPYIHYAILNMLGIGFRLPLFLRTGGIGILKSLGYAFIIIFITGLLEKRKIRLSI
ncbi:DUF5009 domain-containing protein [Flavitalea flava]